MSGRCQHGFTGCPECFPGGRVVELAAVEPGLALRDDVEGFAPYVVRCGVKGARRVTTRAYVSLPDANAAALRWSRSNSTGSYWAQVFYGPMRLASV